MHFRRRGAICWEGERVWICRQGSGFAAVYVAAVVHLAIRIVCKIEEVKLINGSFRLLLAIVSMAPFVIDGISDVCYRCDYYFH